MVNGILAQHTTPLNFQKMGINGNENGNSVKAIFSYSERRKFSELHQNTKVEATKRKKDTAWETALQEFTQATTLHGFRYARKRDTLVCRRLIWIGLLLLGSGLMCYQIIDRILFFYQRTVNVNVKVNFNRSLTFPAVTICNQNAFRASATARNGVYKLVENIYSGNYSSVELEKFNAENLSVDELFVNNSHRKEDLIVECVWDGMTCSPDNFTMVRTDHGVCYTFQGSRQSLQVHSAGSDNGLRLTLNIEQYEYMPGPHGAAGLKIFMHDKTDTPLVGELGLAVPAGSHSFVGNSLHVVKNLKPPYGKCGERELIYFDHYTSANCKMERITRFMEERCGCRDFYMPDREGKPPVCSLQQKYDCMLPALESFKTESNDFCGQCFVSCSYQLYQPTLSFASISNFVIDKLLSRVNLENVYAKFLHATETTHRFEENKFQKFKRQIDTLQFRFHQLRLLLTNDIPEKLDFLLQNTKKQKNTTGDIWARKYHVYRYQDFVIRKNFLRGRDAMEERILGQIANGFQVSILTMEQKLEALADREINDTSVRFTLYKLMKDSLARETEMVRRGISNFTKLIDAYDQGIPIFWYKYLGYPRKDNRYVVPKHLLNFALRRTLYAVKYGLNITNDLELLLAAILRFDELLENVYNTFNLNATEFSEAAENYRFKSKMYYHNRANLYFESIDWAAKELTRRKDHFFNLKGAVDWSFHNMESTIKRVAISLSNAQLKILPKLAYACDIAKLYLSNTTVSKLEVSQALTSKHMQEGINSIQVFLQEVRSRGQTIFDDWTNLIYGIGQIWTDIVEDEDSFEYYGYRNMTDFLQSKEDVLERLESTLASIRDSGDFRNVIQNRDRIFLTAVGDFMVEAEKFKKSTTLDEIFLRDNFVFLNIYYSELSYEEITQQEGYGLFPLLCDIGGSMGLFIGASALTVFEILDLLVYRFYLDCFQSRTFS